MRFRKQKEEQLKTESLQPLVFNEQDLANDVEAMLQQSVDQIGKQAVLRHIIDFQFKAT